MPNETKPTTPCYVVREIATGGEVHRVEVSPGGISTGGRRDEKILRGMLINMDTDRFFVDTAEVDEAGGAP